MDLFGTKRRHATQLAVDYIRPLLGTIQHFYGLPPRFWMDDFVLGFIWTMMAKVSGTALNELSTEAKGQALTEALTTLSNQNGQAISRRVIELAQIQTPDFVRGSNNAFTVFLYFTGRLPDEASNPDVIAAKQFALASGQVDVMSALLHKLFHQVVVERFELGDQ